MGVAGLQHVLDKVGIGSLYPTQDLNLHLVPRGHQHATPQCLTLRVPSSCLNSLAKHLDKSRLAVTEAVFGVLLAALAVQLMLDGLADLDIIAMVIAH